MKVVELTKVQFKWFVYPYIVRASAETDAEVEVAIRLIKKLHDPDKVVVDPTSPEEDAAIAEGLPVYKSRSLKSKTEKFHLERDEWQLLLSRVKEGRKDITFVALEDFQAVIDQIEGAPDLEISE